MYNETIETKNKIITCELLKDILNVMNDKIKYYLKIYESEEKKNSSVGYNEEKWTFKNFNSELTFSIDFSDSTSISVENYYNFLSIFESRLEDIRRIYCYFRLNYSDGTKSYYNRITMYIYEDSFKFDFEISEDDNKVNDIYEYIKEKIKNAPLKYDYIISHYSSINNKIGFAIGFIPIIILFTLLLFNSDLKLVFKSTYILFPLCVIFCSKFIGKFFSNFKLKKYYDQILPDKKYIGYSKGYRYYKYDIEKFKEKSDVLIGSKIKYMEYRDKIYKEYEKYKKYLPYEILILFVISTLIVII